MVEDWADCCAQNKIDYEILNPFENGCVSCSSGFDVVLWHYSSYSFKDMLIAKNTLFAMEKLGKKVFPSINDSSHVDDKLAETYLLQAIGTPIPKSHYYYSLHDVKAVW